MIKIYLIISIIIISSCSTTSGQEKYEQRINDLSRNVEVEVDEFYGTKTVKLKLIDQVAGAVEFDDPQEKITWNMWTGASAGCKFGGGAMFAPMLKIDYRLTGGGNRSVRIVTMLSDLTPRYGDVYSIKIGNNAPIDINSNGDWKKEYPEEVVFGTEQPWFVSFSNLENKHIRILEQLSDQEKLGLNNIIYSMKREGTNSSGNRRQKTSDCRVVNNGRFTYILDRYNYMENFGL
jgi:hypothetical protein